MLKVTIAEVDRDIAKQLGITSSSLTANWGTFNQVNPFGINGAIAQSAIGALTPSGVQGTALTAHNPSSSLTATLEAFERYGVTRILAEPTVSAVSGESAKLTVGGEIPIPGPPSCSIGGLCTVTVIYKDYGVSLRFTPVVLAEGRIELHLGTEVTDIDNTQAQVTLAGFPVPAFLTRHNRCQGRDRRILDRA
jgi:pilus assembly protein CpaC